MIKQMILLTPAIFLVHDAEEILTIESWLQANLPEMERWIGRFTWQQKMLNSHKVNTLQFSIAVLIIFTILLAVTLPVARKPQKGRQADLFLICFAMLYLHAFVHIGQAVMLRRYTPGVLTAVLVLLPFGHAMNRVLKSEGLLTDARGLGHYGAWGMAGLIPLVLSSLGAGRLIGNHLESPNRGQ